MSHITFKTTHRRQTLLLWATLVVFLVIALVGCRASEGGQADPNSGVENPPKVEGTDRKKVEFKGVDVEVQKVVIDGTTCIVASYEEAAISCDWGAP